ncbi:MAG TPA: hypothetical protein EYH34_16090 [Planctomycetes bacterium]|nr:hypothetical protein [Planctomycetota bacterium]
MVFVLGLLFAGACVVCCGGLVGLGWYFMRGMTDDPAEVRRVTQQMLQIELPEKLQPAMAMEVRVPWGGQPVFTMAFYVDPATQSALGLVSSPHMSAEQKRPEMERRLKESFRQQGFDIDADWEEIKQWEREIEVRGEKVRFTFTSGTDRESGTRFLALTGLVQGDRGPVMLTFVAPADQYGEEGMVKVIESIR